MKAVTPDEASKLICPAGLSSDDGLQYCRGEACMAWRWQPKLSRWVEDHQRESGNVEKGYCGLGGKP